MRVAIKRKYLIRLATVIFVLLIYALQSGWLGNSTVNQMQGTSYIVVGFSDGDTITVDMAGHEEIIRFIGVDTPETHKPNTPVQCFGKQASIFTKSKIGNDRVGLVADPLSTNRDKYNRLLRYVYLQSGELLNAELIKQGYGFAYIGFPFTKSIEFSNYQINAQKNKIGLWDLCQPYLNKYGAYQSS